MELTIESVVIAMVLLFVQVVLGYCAAKAAGKIYQGYLALATLVVVYAPRDFNFLLTVGLSAVCFIVGVLVFLSLEKQDKEESCDA